MSEMKILEVRYIGRTKTRRGGEDRSALGYMAGQWLVIFPEKVLRKWFDDEDPTTEKNLYAVLGAKDSSSSDEIKTAFRRMSLQWHPDVCKEPNATDVFLRIKEAYEILSNPNKRARYDAGLAFEKLSKRSYTPPPAAGGDIGYRTPLRCGLIMVNARQSGKWTLVDEILEWQDITDYAGRTLSVSWIYGQDTPVEYWI